MAVDHLIIDDQKIMLESLSSDQAYIYSQMVDLNEKIAQTKRELDVLNMAYKGFEDMMVNSFK